jgi:uncharacterized membrane protein YoaK (UPF0700 family)
VTGYDRRSIALAVSLSALAGYVDALGFLQLGGYFVSFMSGNSTRLGVDIATGNGHEVLLVGGILLLFVFGAFLGALVGSVSGRRSQSAVLFSEAALLGAAAMLQAVGQTMPAIGLMVLAMGLENAVFQRDGEVAIGLTYMTGALVKIGQRLAAAVRGGSRTAWMPYLLLWIGLAAGALAGAATWHAIGLAGLWFAAGFCLLLAVLGSRWQHSPR